MAVEFVISHGGIRAIHNDATLKFLQGVARRLQITLEVSRASHVEPALENRFGGNWFVDLRPSGGGLYYVDEAGEPFRERQEALAFEVRWLKANWLHCSPGKELNDVGNLVKRRGVGLHETA